MKISIVMACFNAEATVGRAIQSFVDQDWPERELIVIDGASRDRTCDIVRAFQHPAISLVSEPDKGIYDAINKGVRAATGDVIGLLHADDFFAAPDVLSRAAAAFEDRELDGVYADATFFSAGDPDQVVRRYRSDRFRPDRLRWGIMPAHTTLFLRRGVFDRFGLYKTDYRISGDYEFVARIFGKGGVKALHVPEVWVRMQAGGASTGGIRSKIVLNREVLRACHENGIDTNYLMILSKYPAKILEYVRRAS